MPHEDKRHAPPQFTAIPNHLDCATGHGQGHLQQSKSASVTTCTPHAAEIMLETALLRLTSAPAVGCRLLLHRLAHTRQPFPLLATPWPLLCTPPAPASTFTTPAVCTITILVSDVCNKAEISAARFITVTNQLQGHPSVYRPPQQQPTCIKQFHSVHLNYVHGWDKCPTQDC